MLKCILEKKTIPSLLSKKTYCLADIVIIAWFLFFRNKRYVSISTYSLTCLIQIIELPPSQPEKIELETNV